MPYDQEVWTNDDGPPYLNEDELNRIEQGIADAHTKAVLDAIGIDAATLEGSTLAQLQTAIIAAIVDSSPATLDTLNELAAALGDDPDFATTITNALAGKQALSEKGQPGGYADYDDTQGALSDKAAKGQSLYLPAWVAGRYYGVGATLRASAIPAEASAVYTPLAVPADSSIDRIAVDVITAGGAGAVMRLGLYNDNGTGRPGTLLLDAGTVDVSTTGTKEIIVAQALSAGLIWMVAVVQGAAATRPTMRSHAQGFVASIHGNNAIDILEVAYAYFQGGVSGALPDPAAITGVSSSQATKVAVRAA